MTPSTVDSFTYETHNSNDSVKGTNLETFTGIDPVV